MKIAVVIPTFNRSSSLQRAVQSCLDQSFQPAQIIVVDDASTDDTATAFPAWLVNHGFASTDLDAAGTSSATFHHNASGIEVCYRCQAENRGPAAARNAGMRLATGDAIAFLDSDDILSPDSLAVRVAFLAANPQVDVVVGDGRGVAAGKVDEQTFFTHLGVRDRLIAQPATGGWIATNLFDAQLRRPTMTTSLVMVRHDGLTKVEGFDESLRVAEDWECWLRWSQFLTFGFVEEVVAMQHVGDDQLTKQRRSRIWQETHVAVGRKILAQFQLDAEQRQFMQRRYADDLFELGYTSLWHFDDRWTALRHFANSLQVEPSTRCLKGLVACLIPMSLRLKIKGGKRSSPEAVRPRR